MRKYCLLAALLHLAPVQVYAGLSYYGYQKTYSYENDDSTVAERWVGHAKLDAVTCSVTPKGSYLDIEEEAYLSGNIDRTRYSNLLDIFDIKGSLLLPAEAVVVGLMVWREGTPHKATLGPAEYEEHTSYADSGALRQDRSTKFISLQKTTPEHYQIILSDVPVGRKSRVKIRYLLPNKAGGTPSYGIPVLFDQYSSYNPRFLKFELKSAGPTPHTLIAGKTRLSVKGTETYMLDYIPSIRLECTKGRSSLLHLTTFEQNRWEGDYLHLNTTVPGELLAGMIKPIETVFLWRWNAPSSFVQTDEQGANLSNFGRDVLNQAQDIGRAAYSLTSRGYRVGLVHSIEGGPRKTFEIGTGASPEFAAVQMYLNSVDEELLLDKYAKLQSSRPSWAPTQSENVTATDGSREEFMESIHAALALYTDDKGVVRHLVFLSAGPVTRVNATISKAKVDSLLEGISTDSRRGIWRGVDFSALFTSVHHQRLKYLSGFFFPLPDLSNHSVSLTIGTGGQHYTFPLPTDPNHAFSVLAKSSAPWDTTVVWKGFGTSGKLLATYEGRPMCIRAYRDSGLVKVWAGDDGRITDVPDEQNIGGTYGIVTKQFTLEAGPEDSVPVGSELTYLTDDEIFLPVGLIQSNHVGNAGKTKVYHSGGKLVIVGLKHRKGHLTLFDARGRKVLELDLSQVANISKVVLPADALGGAAWAVLIMRIQTDSYTLTESIMAGGLR